MWVLVIPFLLLLLSLVTVILLVLKRWKWGLICAAMCVIINVWSETFPLNPQIIKNARSFDLRVASYNIDCLGSGEKKEGWEKELISFIEDSNPDILFLAEFQYHDFGRYSYLLDSISHTRFFKTVVDVRFGRKDVVYSKYSIKDFHVITINPECCENSGQYKEITESYYQNLNPMIYQMTMEVKGKNIQVVCCHLASNEFNVAKRDFRNTGLNGIFTNLGKGYVYRDIEANTIVKALDPSVPTILMGDLNDINGSSVMSIFKNAGLNDAWWQVGSGYGHTYNKHGLYFRLDHILVSDFLSVVEMRVPRYEASDHYPVVADIIIK